MIFHHEPFSKRHILDSSKLKDFADDYFKFEENGRKFSKRVENTIGKGEIAPYEQFLLFPQCFQKTSTANTKKKALFGKGLGLTLTSHNSFHFFTEPRKNKDIRNIASYYLLMKSFLSHIL